MKKISLNKIVLFLAVLVMAGFSGCASTCNTCNSGGLFGGNRLFQNQPVRSTIRSWFQGDDCSTCNTPSGQVLNPNIAPLCETGNCGQAPLANGVAPLYGSPNGVQIGTPNLQNVPQVQPGPDAIGNGVNPPQM